MFRGNASQAGATSKSLEVRSVLYWAEMEHFVAVGWSRSLMCYADKPHVYRNFGTSYQIL